MHQKIGQPRIHSDGQVRQFHDSGMYGDQLLVDYLDAHARERPDKIAIIEAHRQLSYREVAAWSENVAASLLKLGVGQGDVVAVKAPNWAELPIIHFAANRIGAIFVPLSEGFRSREISHLLAQSRAKVVFCPRELRGTRHADEIEQMRDLLPDLQHVVTMRDASTRGPSFDEMAAYDAWRVDEAPDWLSGQRADADAPSHVMVSSGTTGLPRCSMFSDNNTLVKLLQQYLPAARVDGADVAAALAPAGTGSTGYNYPILTMLLVGGTSVMLEHWSAAQMSEPLELIKRYGCTVAVVVPAQLAKLVQEATRHDYGITTLRVITNAGAKLPASVAEAAEQVFGCKVQSIYGTSEAGATAMTRVDDADSKRRGTVGQPLAGQEVKIIDDAGTALRIGEIGEVCWRGSNKSYGFLNDAENTLRVWGTHGWLHSGDLGFIDAAGYLNIAGRKKDMIIRGGQNINPGAIEEALLGHPNISEIAIVAIVDEVLGERIAACAVARRQGVVPSLDSLKALILDLGMAAWHQPECLLLLDELPRNAGGKIDKKALSIMATEAYTAGAGSPMHS
ncbi:MAG: class I adenylate-forming enzyme family protein [Janthinobacterium lividum]